LVKHFECAVLVVGAEPLFVGCCHW